MLPASPATASSFSPAESSDGGVLLLYGAGLNPAKNSHQLRQRIQQRQNEVHFCLSRGMGEVEFAEIQALQSFGPHYD